MAEVTLFEKVKQAMGISGNALDNSVKPYFDDAVDFMLGAGMTQDKIETSVGTIARGVNDLWNNGSGDFSQAFIKRVSQLAMRK